MVMWHSRVDRCLSTCLSVCLSQSVVQKFILKKRSCLLMLSVPLILLGPPAESPRADGHVAQSSGQVLVYMSVSLSVAIGSAEVYSEEEELPSDAVCTPHPFGTSRGVASSGWSCGTVEWTGACLHVCQSVCRNR